MPALQIALIDADGRIVLRLDVRPAKTSLGPGESVTVNEAVVDVPRSAVTAEFSLKLPAGSPPGNTQKVTLNAGGLYLEHHEVKSGKRRAGSTGHRNTLL